MSYLPNSSLSSSNAVSLSTSSPAAVAALIQCSSLAAELLKNSVLSNSSSSLGTSAELVALAAELEAEVEDAGLVAELLGAEATFATAPAAEAVELADEDLEVVDGKTVLQEIPPVPDARTTDGRAVSD